MVRPAAKREAVAHLRNVLQMSERRCESASNCWTPIHNGDPGFSERSSDVECSGILIGLNADERNKPEIVVMPKAG